MFRDLAYALTVARMIGIVAPFGAVVCCFLAILLAMHGRRGWAWFMAAMSLGLCALGAWLTGRF